MGHTISIYLALLYNLVITVTLAARPAAIEDGAFWFTARADLWLRGLAHAGLRMQIIVPRTATAVVAWPRLLVATCMHARNKQHKQKKAHT
mgnify:CR=1